jgi:hypothetical protein
VDGPWLDAILTVLHDVHDLLDARLPSLEQAPERGREPAPEPPETRQVVPVSEPAPDRPPTHAEPVTRPGPDRVPEDDGEAEGGNLPPEPPRTGHGSAAKNWRPFAAAAGVTCPDGASRNDIIAACIAAGVIAA